MKNYYCWICFDGFLVRGQLRREEQESLAGEEESFPPSRKFIRREGNDLIIKRFLFLLITMIFSLEARSELRGKSVLSKQPDYRRFEMWDEKLSSRNRYAGGTATVIRLLILFGWIHSPISEKQNIKAIDNIIVYCNWIWKTSSMLLIKQNPGRNLIMYITEKKLLLIGSAHIE